MNNWKKRTQYIESYFYKDKLTTIPQLDSSFVIDDLIKVLSEETSQKSINKIFILDPYLATIDLPLIIKCFAEYSGRELVIITRLKPIPKPPEEKSLSKEEVQELFRESKKRLIDNGIFASINIYPANREFHDRYIFSTDGIDNDYFFSVGSSINSLFKGYSNIIRIRDINLKRQIIELSNLLIDSVTPL